MFDLQATALPNLNSGKVKTLAITSKTHNPQLPEVHTMSEGGVAGHEVSAWFGVFAPEGLPDGITQRLNQSVTTVLKTPAMQRHLRDLGAEPDFGSSAAFSAYVRDESVKWGGVGKAANIVPWSLLPDDHFTRAYPTPYSNKRS